jgi:Arc/MetJ-type ribon-helix-helix transcriptional regulator
MVWDRLVEEKVAVYISKSLYNEVESKSRESGGEFTSVEECVEFVLRAFLKKEGEKETYTRDDEEKIKQRLKRLGYL